jgi:hypothetical protein
MSTVVIKHNANIEQAIQDALRQIAVEPLVRGKLVAVKPNETYASTRSIRRPR